MGRAPSQTKLRRFIENSGSMLNDPDYPIFQAGVEEGQRAMRSKALTFLEQKYIGPNAPERGSVEGDAILTLARELSEELSLEG